MISLVEEVDQDIASQEISLTGEKPILWKPPILYMIITNISKPTNIRTLLMAGVAFGCQGFFIVGQKKFDFSISSKDLPLPLRHSEQFLRSIERFSSLVECVDYVKCKVKAKVCGVEIVNSALDVNAEPFETDANLCLMIGNEGTGLSTKQMELCDYFVRISQFGGGTASLNVSVAASIVMQRFLQWRRASSRRNVVC